MSLSVQAVKDAAESVRPMKSRSGCFLLDPPVALVDVDSRSTVHARVVDEHGRYPDTVHLEERTHWWPVNSFELPAR